MQPRQHQRLSPFQHTNPQTVLQHCVVSLSTIILHALRTPPLQQSMLQRLLLLMDAAKMLHWCQVHQPTFILANTSLLNMPLVLSVSGTLIVICRVVKTSHGVSLKLPTLSCTKHFPMPLMSARSWLLQQHRCTHFCSTSNTPNRMAGEHCLAACVSVQQHGASSVASCRLVELRKVPSGAAAGTKLAANSKAEQAAHNVAALQEGVPVGDVLHTQLLQLRVLVAAVIQAFDFPPLQRSTRRSVSSEMKQRTHGSLVWCFTLPPAGAADSWLAGQLVTWSDIQVRVCW